MSVRLGLWFALWVSTALGGCGDGGGLGMGDGALDAGLDGGLDGGALLVTPPSIPWLAEGVPPIMLAPCPEGWRTVDGAVTECDPYPEGGPDSCEAGAAHFPGEPGCRPIGDACPPGDYAGSVPTTGVVVYVKAGAPAGGDGTMRAPFATLDEVPWTSLATSTTVALGKGTYAGALPLKAGVGVLGACVRDTILTGLAAPVSAVVSVASAGEPAAVENLTIRGAPQYGAEVGGGRRLSLQGVLVEQALRIGILAQDAGTEVTLRDVVVRDTVASGPVGSSYGIGIHADHGARLEATRLLVVGNRFVGVSASRGASLVFADAVVRDTRPRDGDRSGGRGLSVARGARLLAARLLVARNHDVGVFASEAEVGLTDVLVRETKSRANDGQGGRGISLEAGATLSARRLVVSRNRAVGVLVTGTGSTIALTDAVLRDTMASESGTAGRAVSVEDGARFGATRILVWGYAEAGAYASDMDTTVSFTDAAFREPLGPGTPQSLAALAIQGGARFSAARLAVTDDRNMGLLIAHEGTTVRLSDTVVQPFDGMAQRLGRGIEVQSGARLEGSRVRVDHSALVGVSAFFGADVVLEDASIHRVDANECVSPPCPTALLAFGVGSVAASVSLTRFHITDAATCGVLVTPEAGDVGGALDLEVGVVSGAQIGACVQVDGYDLARLTADVRYTENGTNLDSTTLPVPDASPPLER